MDAAGHPCGGAKHSHSMNITQQNRNSVLAVLAANPKATMQPMYHNQIVEKTGLSSPRVTAIRKELVVEGRIREEGRSSPVAIYLMVEDKLQQIIDLVATKEGYGPEKLSRYTGLTKDQVHQLLLRLFTEGLVEITRLNVEASPRLLRDLERQKRLELQTA